MNLNLPGMRSAQKSASFFKRLGAFIIDLLIIDIVIISPFSSLFQNYLGSSSSLSAMLSQAQSMDVSGVYTAVFFISLLSLGYFVSFEVKLSQTIGMMVFNLKVSKGITVFKSIVRNLFVFPFFPLSILWVIEPIHLLLRGKRLSEDLTKTDTVEQVKV